MSPVCSVLQMSDSQPAAGRGWCSPLGGQDTELMHGSPGKWVDLLKNNINSSIALTCNRPLKFFNVKKSGKPPVYSKPKVCISFY